MKGRLLIAAVVLGTLAVAAAAYLQSPRGEAGASAGAFDGRAVVLISLDTTRADRIHSYGYRQPTSPNIDQLAGEGVRYAHHHAPVPYTLPSHATMLTGTIPPYHGVHSNVRQRLGDSNITLAQVLAKRGYHTGAFVSAYVMEADFGLDKGFDVYDGVIDLSKTDNDHDNHTERQGGETVARALHWLDGHADKPFFLFVHLFDPHAPYAAPQAFADRFKDPYDAEIAYADHCVGLVVDRLKQLGVYDKTLIVVTADHGEGLGDHGEMTHGFFTYQSTQHVPMVIRPTADMAGVKRGSTVTQTTSLTDVAPTILGALDVAAPAAMQGRDLSPTLAGSAVEKQLAYIESLSPTLDGGNPLVGVVDDRWKFILTSRPELYDLAADPGELNNLFEKHPAEARRLRGELKRILTTQSRTDTGDSSLALDGASIERLRSLGYVGGAVADGANLLSIDPGKRDPKDMADITLPVYEAMSLLEQGEYGKAEAIAAKLIERDADLPAPYLLLGEVAEHREQMDKAIGYYKTHLDKVEQAIAASQTPRLKDDYIDGLAFLAAAYQKADQIDDAVARYEQLLAAAPDHFMSHRELARIHHERGEVERSIEHTRRLVVIRPDFAEAHYNLAVHLAKKGDAAGAETHYRAAVEHDPTHFRAHKNLGMLAAQANRMEEAIELWSTAAKLSPDDVKLRHNLATAQARQGDVAAAVAQWEAIVKLAPDFKPAWKSLAMGYKALGRADDAARAAGHAK